MMTECIEHRGKRFHTSTLVVAVTLIAIAPNFAFGKNADSRASTQPQDVSSPSTPQLAAPVAVKQVASDDEIAQRLTRILKASKWVADARVRVEEGIVFLDGTTDDDKNRDWAAKVAGNTEGVIAVVNNIEVVETVDVEESLDHIGKSLGGLWRDFLKRVPMLLAAVVIVFLTWAANHLATSLVVKTTRKSRFRSSLRDLLLQLTTFFVWLGGLMIAAIVVFPGMTPAKLLTVLGLSSVALGFAFKDIFENFFAGVLILWRFPFDKGDFIKCGEIEGRVEDITIRMSKIRQVDGQLVVVPNAMLFKQPVHVLTNSSTRRVTILCGVAYDEDVDQCRDVIQRAVSKCDTVADGQAIEIFAREFASSSINFEVTWWTGSTPLDVRRSRDQVVAAVKCELDAAGIEIPFPYRTLTFKSPIPIADS